MVIASWPEDAPRGAVTRFCKQNGVSRSWFYEVRARARDGDGTLASTLPLSRAPKHPARATPPVVEDLALRIRKELAEDGWDHGPLSVRSRMLAMGLPAPSRSTLAAIFARRGAVVPQPQKRPRASWRRFSFARPNECWQLDAMARWLADGSEVCVLQVIDDHSRAILASLAAPAETAVAALAVVQAAIARYGIPQRLLSDNGTALNQSRRGRATLLQNHLGELGVQPIASTPNHPQTCGKHERSHQTLQRWLRARPAPADLAELQARLDTFDLAYNTTRPHQALAGRNPMQVYAATPKAPTPSPPEPVLPQAPKARMQIRSYRVDERGYLHPNKLTVMIGVPYAGRTFHIVLDPDQLTLFTADETHFRDIELEPGRRYYGNGRPTGGRRQPRLPSGMSSDS